MTFSFSTVFGGVSVFLLICDCLAHKAGPLAVLGIWILHIRAVLLCARRELSRVPERWRQQYPLAVQEARRRG